MRKFVPFAALVLVAAVGCKPSPEKIVQGNWKASEVKLPAQLEKNPMAAMAKGMLSNSTLKVEETKKYTLTMGPIPIEGSWTISGRALTMTPEKFQGRPVADVAAQMKNQPGAENITQPTTYNLSEDGKSLSASNQGMTLIFTKTEG